MTPEEVIRKFYADCDYPLGCMGAAEKWLRDDCPYIVNGDSNTKNKQEVLDNFDSYNFMYRRPYSKVTILELVVSGNLVMTERTEDLYHINNPENRFLGRLMSVFRVDENDKIYLWKDYFDQGNEYGFGRAAYIPNVQEMNAYRAELGLPPREHTNTFDIVSAYNMNK